MNKKNRVFRVASLLLVLCFVSTVMISGTFAKYTSEFVGQDTALIAKWDIGFSDGETGIIGDEIATLDLFSHAYDVNIVQSVGEGENKQYIIAPGVSGEFTLSVTNKSDVAAKVEFEFTPTNPVSPTDALVPIEYAYDDGSGENLVYGNLVQLADILTGVMNVDVDGNESVDVKWRWPYEASDAVYVGSTNLTDTDLGIASATAAAAQDGSRTTYILTVTATATQLTPGDGVVIIGTPKVGEMLTAMVSPGVTGVTYQWQKNSGTDGAYVNIGEATSATYTPATGDVGNLIRVVASWTDGSNQVEKTSAPVGPVAEAAAGD